MLLTLIITQSVFADSDCLLKYKSKFFKKNEKYDKAVHRYNRRYKKYKEKKKRSIEAAFHSNPLVAAVGVSSYKSIDPPVKPKIEDYKMFEKSIIRAYEVNLSSDSSEESKLLTKIYDKASIIAPGVSQAAVQKVIRTQMDSGEYCGWFSSVKKPQGVMDIVLNKIKKDRKNIVLASEANINDVSINQRQLSFGEGESKARKDTSSANEQ